MKLSELKIENFRSFKNETIRFDDYNCLVGPNGSGKSVVLMALNIFFQESESTVTDVRTLSIEDFHHKNKDEPVIITMTFEGLSEAAQEEFKEYYRQGKLVIFAKAVWDDATQSAPVKHFGSRLVMREFSGFFKAEKEGKSVSERREIYRGIRVKFPELQNISTGTGMRAALREHEEKHPKKCIFLDEPNQFYGFTKGQYHLENYIQWVYVPAVKDASTEQEEGTKTALGQLLARTVRTKLDFTDAIDGLRSDLEEKYRLLLRDKKEALDALQLSIEKRLQDYGDPRAVLKLDWHLDPKASVTVREPLARASIGYADFIGEVARAGHGMQRGFLLAILHELVGNEEKGGPKLLLGIEEPELYQHPPQAQHLADVLERLSLPGNNAQIIVTTHSPYFVRSELFENIRMFCKSEREHCTKISWTTHEKVEGRLAKVLGQEPKSPTTAMAIVNQIMHPSQRELFFTTFAVLVEGPEDVAYISSHLHLSGQWRKFRELGCHFIVSGGKTSLIRFLAIAKELDIWVFVLFDSDAKSLRKKVETTKGDLDKHIQAKENLKNNSRINSSILKLCNASNATALPDKTLWLPSVVVWPDTISSTVKEECGEEAWNIAENEVRKNLELKSGITQRNPILITATLEELCKQNKKSASLVKLCAAILQDAQKTKI